jgi:uncharacterized RDD family membrane protein YckC
MSDTPRTPSPAPAGLIRRLMAMLYDTLLVAALLMVVALAAVLVTSLLPGSTPEDLYPPPVWYRLLLFTSWFGFFGWFWTRGGATLGMQAWHVVLQREDGGPIGWRLAARRFAAATLSLAPFGLGYFWMLIDPHRRTWHDRLTGTRVVLLRDPH